MLQHLSGAISISEIRNTDIHSQCIMLVHLKVALKALCPFRFGFTGEELLADQCMFLRALTICLDAFAASGAPEIASDLI